MQNYMKTILSAVQTWTKGKIKDSTADWNQNDSSADNYVKNRTHWEETVVKEVEYLPETTVGHDLNEGDGYYSFEGSFHTELIIGRKYTVVFNGEIFENLTCFDDEGYPTIGAPYGDFGEYHFCLYTWIDDDGQIWLSNITDLEGAHTISIVTTEVQTVVHKLDHKYLNLPTNLATTDDVQSVKQEVKNIAETAQTTAETAQTTAETAQTTADSKMNATNPVGTGTFNMNGNATGAYSCVIGKGNIATRGYQTVVGRYNKFDDLYQQSTKYNTTTTTISQNATVYISKEYSFDTANGNYVLVDPIIVTATQLYNGGYNDYYAPIQYGKNGSYNNIVSNVASYPNICRISSVTSYNNYNYKVVHSYSTMTRTFNTESGHLIIVGNGASDDARSNAHTLDWNGVGWFQGGLQVGGNAQDDGAKNVLLEGDVLKEDEVLDTLIDTDMIACILDSDGSVLADENGDIISM